MGSNQIERDEGSSERTGDASSLILFLLLLPYVDLHSSLHVLEMMSVIKGEPLSSLHAFDKIISEFCFVRAVKSNPRSQYLPWDDPQL